MSKMNNNILLIRPPEFIISKERIHPEKQTHGAILLPLGILHLGSYVKYKFPDAQVYYLDLHLNCKHALKNKDSPVFLPDFIYQRLKDKLEQIRPQVVGISCALNAFAANFHDVAKIVKRISPGAHVVAGGHYPSSYYDRVACDENIEYIVIGEGEIPFTKFIADMQKGVLPEHKLLNEKKTYLDDVNSFPPLDYAGLEVEKYFEFEMNSVFGKQDRTINVLSSRGCPCKCIYCATHNVWDYGFRAQNAENVFRQVIDLRERYNIQTVMFVDDNFVLDKYRVKEFCRLLIKNNVKINWYPTSVMINCLDEEMIGLMARSGCRSLGLAVESGARQVQSLIKKNVNLEHAKRIVECMKREGLLVHGLFVLGFPGETVEEMKQTINYARQLRCDWCQLSIAMPLYGTEMYERCRENNYLINKDNVVDLYVERIGNISTPDFTPEVTESIVRDANFRLNFLENPNYLDGFYDKALPIFESIARSYPDHFICKYMIWKIYKEIDGQKAEAAYKNLKTLYETDARYCNGLINTYALEISF